MFAITIKDCATHKEFTVLTDRFVLAADGAPKAVEVTTGGTYDSKALEKLWFALSGALERLISDARARAGAEYSAKEVLERTWEASSKTPADLAAYYEGMTALYKAAGWGCSYWA